VSLFLHDVYGIYCGLRISPFMITPHFVEHMQLSETLRLSFTCKKLYIVMGDLRVLRRYEMKKNQFQEIKTYFERAKNNEDNIENSN